MVSNIQTLPWGSSCRSQTGLTTKRARPDPHRTHTGVSPEPHRSTLLWKQGTKVRLRRGSRDGRVQGWINGGPEGAAVEDGKPGSEGSPRRGKRANGVSAEGRLRPSRGFAQCNEGRAPASVLRMVQGE